MMLRILVEGEKETLQTYDYNHWIAVPKVTVKQIEAEETKLILRAIEIKSLEKELAEWVFVNAVPNAPEHAQHITYSYDKGAGEDLYGLTEGWRAEGENLESYPHTYAPFYAPKPPEKFSGLYAHYTLKRLYNV